MSFSKAMWVITNLSITALVYSEFKMLILYQLQAKPKRCFPIEVHVEHLWPKYDFSIMKIKFSTVNTMRVITHVSIWFSKTPIIEYYYSRSLIVVVESKGLFNDLLKKTTTNLNWTCFESLEEHNVHPFAQSSTSLNNCLVLIVILVLSLRLLFFRNESLATLMLFTWKQELTCKANCDIL